MVASSEMYERSVGRAYWISLALIFLTLEALARALHPTFLSRAPDGYISNAAHVRDVLSKGRDEKAVVLLGDSVLGPSALMEHHTIDPRSKSLSSNVIEVFRLSNQSALSLGADGMLPTDMEAITSELPTDFGGRVVIILNARMFSPEYQSPATERFFPFLNRRARIDGIASQTTDDVRLGGLLFDTLSERSVLFRTLHQLRGFWFTPSPEGRIQQTIETFFGYEGEGDLKEAILRQKVAPFYAPRVWSKDEPQVRALLAMVTELTARHIPVSVIFSPQNPDYTVPPSTSGSLGENVARLRGWIEEAVGSRLYSFVDTRPPDSFLDHCHLTPEANASFADEIVRVVKEGA